MVKLLWKTFWRFLIRFSIELPFDPAIPFLSVYLCELQAYLPKAYRWIFTASLLITATKWIQLKYPSNDEWINKMWCAHTMEYYSAPTERNKVLRDVTTWMNLVYAKWKKPITKDQTLCYSCYRKCPEYKNPQKRKVDFWDQGKMGSDWKWCMGFL